MSSCSIFMASRCCHKAEGFRSMAIRFCSLSQSFRDMDKFSGNPSGATCRVRDPLFNQDLYYRNPFCQVMVHFQRLDLNRKGI